MSETLLDHLDGDTADQYKSISRVILYFHPLHFKIFLQLNLLKSLTVF
jgi:hypothetical protein